MWKICYWYCAWVKNAPNLPNLGCIIFFFFGGGSVFTWLLRIFASRNTSLFIYAALCPWASFVPCSGSLFFGSSWDISHWEYARGISCDQSVPGHHHLRNKPPQFVSKVTVYILHRCWFSFIIGYSVYWGERERERERENGVKQSPSYSTHGARPVVRI